MTTTIARRGLLLVGLALAATGARGTEAPAPDRPVPDRPVPDRIVSIGGAVTEILYRLGLGDRIVALDTTSQFPPEAAATKPSVGYMRQLSAEGVLSARPGRVIAVEGSGPPDVLRLVREAGVPVETVPDEPSEAGVRRKIEAVARIAGREPAGAALNREAEAGFRALAADRAKAVAKAGAPVRALFLLSLQNGRALVGGRGTTADGMFALAGAENVAAAIEGYKPMTDEAILAAAPDVVVMMAQGPGGRSSPDVFAGTALGATPAGRAGRLVTMDGLYLLGFGPRTPQAARDLMLALHPGLRLE